ncbi:SH3 domain-containing protein [Cytobacillus sp. Hz8]|uniref:SH3 domain-containing protein n=1 Tax=Cytobacillus sp. Hz8 TaxID=3347168 RepID=UPI0035DF948D
MLKRKIYVSLSLLLTLSLIFLLSQPRTAQAATSTATLVNNAVKAGNTLANVTQVEKSATGKTIPTKEYNAAVSKYNSAKKAVAKLSSKQRTTYTKKLTTVKTQIDRGKKYITAINAGKIIEKRRSTFASQIKLGKLDTKTITAYNSLSTEVSKNSAKFNSVYGAKSRDKLKALYLTPASKVISDYSYTFKVKLAINNINTLLKKETTSTKIASYYKTIVFYIDSVKQSTFKTTLKKEIVALNKTIPSKYQTGTLSKLITIDTNLTKLDQLVGPGKSSAEVPGLYQQLTTDISAFSSSDEALLNKRFKAIMAQLPLSVQNIKELLTKAAIAKGIPPEVVKSIAITENGNLLQFKTNGDVFKSADNGYGIMQVTPQSENDQQYDWEKVKYDINYNITTGVEILLQKWNYATLANPIIPTINDHEKNILENWYFAIMAYNGLSSRNNPLVSDNNPYQVKVYTYMKDRALVDPYVFTKSELKITKDESTGLLSFKDQMSYITNVKTPSTQLYKKGVTAKINGSSNFRKSPSTSGAKIRTLSGGTTVTILEGPIEDSSTANLFSWFKVSVNGTKEVGYLASSNLK